MTAAEAAALLTAEQQQRLDEFVDSAPPLSDAQQSLLAGLFTIDATDPGEGGDANHTAGAA